MKPRLIRSSRVWMCGVWTRLASGARMSDCVGYGSTPRAAFETWRNLRTEMERPTSFQDRFFRLFERWA